MLTVDILFISLESMTVQCIAYRVVCVNPFSSFTLDEFTTNEVFGCTTGCTSAFPLRRYLFCFLDS